MERARRRLDYDPASYIACIRSGSNSNLRVPPELVVRFVRCDSGFRSHSRTTASPLREYGTSERITRSWASRPSPAEPRTSVLCTGAGHHGVWQAPGLQILVCCAASTSSNWRWPKIASRAP